MAGLSPMMAQYMETKKQYHDCILFYRLGDFYEMFFDDALTASKELEITLTGKECGLEERAPMCGVPYHAVDSYLSRLVQKGEQPADAKQAVQWLENLHLLDDAKTAEQIVHSCIAKGYGLARAKQALYEKRIPKAFWEDVNAMYPETPSVRRYLKNVRAADLF